MKNLKLILLTLLSVVSFNLFSQVGLITQNTTSPVLCDGSAQIDSVSATQIVLTSIYWAGNGAVIQQGGLYFGNLCPGTYTVTFTTTGGLPVTYTFNILSGTPCNLTAQLQLTQSQDSTSCDGSAICQVVGGTAPYTFSWSNGICTIGICNNLCPGPICCYVSDANGCTTTICDTITTTTQNTGDTLIINSGGCNTPVGSVVSQIEDCLFDFNSVDTAYLSQIIPGINPLDSLTLLWVFVDTNGIMTTYASYISPLNAQGCYNFTLILYCSQKSLDIKTIIVNDDHFYQLSGINELIIDKKLIKVTDMLGRAVSGEQSGLLIYYYSDGSIKKFYKN